MATLVSQQVNELLVSWKNGSHAALNQSGRWSTLELHRLAAPEIW